MSLVWGCDLGRLRCFTCGGREEGRDAADAAVLHAEEGTERRDVAEGMVHGLQSCLVELVVTVVLFGMLPVSTITVGRL
jgi:hypothetical protein